MRRRYARRFLGPPEPEATGPTSDRGEATLGMLPPMTVRERRQGQIPQSASVWLRDFSPRRRLPASAAHAERPLLLDESAVLDPPVVSSRRPPCETLGDRPRGHRAAVYRHLGRRFPRGVTGADAGGNLVAQPGRHVREEGRPPLRREG